MLIEDVNTSIKRTVTYVLDDVIEDDDHAAFPQNANLLGGSLMSYNAVKATTVRCSSAMAALPDIETESEENGESLLFG